MTQNSSSQQTGNSTEARASAPPTSSSTLLPRVIVRLRDDHGLKIPEDHVRNEHDHEYAIAAADENRDPEFGRPD